MDSVVLLKYVMYHVDRDVATVMLCSYEIRLMMSSMLFSFRQRIYFRVNHVNLNQHQLEEEPSNPRHVSC
jgi:hypothetical protein